MKFIKRFLLLSIFFSCGLGFANPIKPPMPPHYGPENDYRNFRGRRIIDDNRRFIPIFIRSASYENFIFIEIFFTQPINVASLMRDCIFVDNHPISLDIIRFTKNNCGLRFVIPNDSENLEKTDFILEIKDIVSVTNAVIEPVKIEDCQINCEYRYLEREEIWKKS